MARSKALILAALLAPAAAGSSGLSPAHFSFRSRRETSLSQWDAPSDADRDRYPPIYPPVHSHGPRFGYSRFGSEVDLLMELTKTAVLIAAPLVAGWQALLALERMMHEPLVAKPAPAMPVKRREPRAQGSLYTVFYAMLLFGAEYGVLYSLLEYSKHYVFSIPEKFQSPAFLALWVAIALGSKLAIYGTDRATKLLRFPRPAVAIPDEHTDRIQAPSWPQSAAWPGSVLFMGYGNAILTVLQAVTAMGVWENAGYQTSLPAILLFLTQISLSDLWTKTMRDQRQFGYALLLTVPWLATAIATAYAFYEISPSAGHMFLPAVFWVLTSGIMTYKYWKLNGKMALYPVKPSIPQYF